MTDALIATVPTLLVQTVSFCESDCESATVLGKLTFNMLTRPYNEPLSSGAGVPVRVAVKPNYVDPVAAEKIVVICVLDQTFLDVPDQQADTVEQVNRWSEDNFSIKVIVLRTFIAPKEYRSGFSSCVIEKHVDKADCDESIETILSTVAEVLCDCDIEEPLLVISHAQEESLDSDSAVSVLRSTLERSPTLFRNYAFIPGHVGASTAELSDHAVVLAVLTDHYSDDPYCQETLYSAKQQELPIVNLLNIKTGVRREISYGGNVPTLAWHGDAKHILRLTLVEWIRCRLFYREAIRIQELVNLPESRILIRPPEPLNIWDRAGRHSGELILYPDPEIPVGERRVLQRTGMRSKLMTPTAVYGYLRTEYIPDIPDSLLNLQASRTPLEGLKIGLSLSSLPNSSRADGLTDAHYDDVLVQVVRSLASCGAAIAYGGDQRTDGFYQKLANIMSAYNQNARRKPNTLHQYIAIPDDNEDQVGGVGVHQHRIVNMTGSNTTGKQPLLLSSFKAPLSLYRSDMRRVMSHDIAASIAIGGQSNPRGNTVVGYSGMYPGVLEEAWRMLETGKPLYVVGGFGGAAQLLADLLLNQHLPHELYENSWKNNERYVKTLGQCRDHDCYTALALPESLNELGEEILHLGSSLLSSDHQSMLWNGLTVIENRKLFRSTDPIEIAGLVLKGLTETSRFERNESQLSIELVYGDVTGISNVDALSIPVTEGVPIGIAGNSINALLQDRMNYAFNSTRPLIRANSKYLNFDWLHLANLRQSPPESAQFFDLFAAAQSAVSAAKRFGFRRLGMVLYADDSNYGVVETFREMLRSLRALAGKTELVIYESNIERFDYIEKYIKEHCSEEVKLTTREEALSSSCENITDPRAILMVDLSDDEKTLSSTLIPPCGTAIAKRHSCNIDEYTINVLRQGVSLNGRPPCSVPSRAELVGRSELVCRYIFGNDADEVLDLLGNVPLHISHNLAASKIPFELIKSSRREFSVLQNHLSRRLLIDTPDAQNIFARGPQSERLTALIVIDPMGDLVWATAEGKSLVKTLDSRMDTIVLEGTDASRQAILSALPHADIFHYCGHAFFSGRGERESGLNLSGPDWLTIKDIKDLETRLRFVFLNACETGRLTSTDLANSSAVMPNTETAVFAEYFLRAGVEAFVSTKWFVKDQGAKLFSEAFYKQFVDGDTVADSLLSARQKLARENRVDWANYMLYGEGRLSFRRGVGQNDRHSTLGNL